MNSHDDHLATERKQPGTGLTVTAVCLPRSVAAPVLWAWSAAALLSVALGSFIAMQPGFLADLWLVREWLATLADLRDPYPVFANLDYPPNALLLLWPLHFTGETVLAVVFVPAIIAAAAAATWLMSGWLAERLGIDLDWRDRAVLVAMVLAGGCLRGTLWRGQLAPLAFLFGAASLVLARRQRWLSAVALALCAFKPHVAVGFALALSVTGSAAVVLYGAGLVAVKIVLFAAVVGQSPAAIIAGYAANLISLYNGPERVRGLFGIRWVIEDVFGGYEIGTVIYVILGAVTAALLATATLSTRAVAGRTKIAATLMLWTLIFLPHQLYHWWLAMPVLWLLMWPESRLIPNLRVRLAVVAMIIAFDVADIPRALRLVIDVENNWTAGWYTYALSPLFAAAMFVFMLWTILRERNERVPANRAAPLGG